MHITRTALSIWLILSVLLLPSLATAVASTPPPAAPETRAMPSEPLAAHLDAAGYLRSSTEFTGTLDPEGWQMNLEPDGTPRFSAVQTTATNTGWDPRFSPRGTSWQVKALAVDGDSLYVGGGFIAAGDIKATYVAHWNASSGEWSTVGEFHSAVEALLFSGGYLYAGGEYFLSRWDPGTETWTDLGYPFGTVQAIAALGDYIYIGGYFSEVDGVQADSLARWDKISETWEAVGAGVDRVVYALTAGDGLLYLGGEFDSAGGMAAGKIASWNPGSGAWSDLNGGSIGGQVNSLAYYGGSLYAGGWITQTGGVTVTHVARWDGGQWHAMGDNLTGSVNGLSAGSQGVFATTSLTYDVSDPDPFNMGVKWDGGNGKWVRLGKGLDCVDHHSYCETYAVAAANGRLYFGGDFNLAGDQTALHVAVYNLNPGGWSALYNGPYGQGVDGEVLSIAIKGSDVFIGGWFQRVGGIAANHIARWDSQTGTWYALGEGTNWGVYALALMGDNLYVGGRFGMAGGVDASYLARYDTQAGTWHAIGPGSEPGPNDWVEALAVDGSKLYVGGYFTAIRDVGSSDHIAVWDAVAENWTLVDGTDLGNAVFAILPQGDDVFVGGMFYQNAGSAYEHIAHWHLPTDTWHAMDYGLDGDVHTLVPYGNGVLAGGVFPGRVQLWDATGQTWGILPGGWLGGGSYGGIAYDLVVSTSGEIFAVGDFTQAGDTQAWGIAQYSVTCQRWMPIEGGFNARGQSAALVGDRLYAGGSFSLTGDQPAYRFASRTVSDGVCVFVPLVVRE